MILGRLSLEADNEVNTSSSRKYDSELEIGENGEILMLCDTKFLL